MVSMHDNWGECTDVHDFVSMVNKFDNFLGLCRPKFDNFLGLCIHTLLGLVIAQA